MGPLDLAKAVNVLKFSRVAETKQSHEPEYGCSPISSTQNACRIPSILFCDQGSLKEQEVNIKVNIGSIIYFFIDLKTSVTRAVNVTT